MSTVESRFQVLRTHLDQMGYIQTLGIESFPLVERLVKDLSITNDNLRSLQEFSDNLKKDVSTLRLSVDPYRKENSRLISENNNLKHQLMTNKEKSDKALREHCLIKRKGEQQAADLQFLIAQYSKKLQRLENENLEKSKKILQLQEKNLQAVILTPGGQKKPIAFRRQRLEIGQPPASLASPAGLPHVATQVKDVYVADMVKITDSSLTAERNRCNKLQESLQMCEEHKKALHEQVQIRELEIQRLSGLLEAGRSPENVVYNNQAAKQNEQIRQLQLQIKVLQDQNEELRVMNPDKEPPMSRAPPKPYPSNVSSKQSRDTMKTSFGKDKRIEEELWDQLKDMKKKFTSLQTEHETCQQKLHKLRTKLGDKEEQLARIEVLLQQVNAEKEQLSSRVQNLISNEKSLLQELGHLTSEKNRTSGTPNANEVGSHQQHLEDQLESLTEYVRQLEAQRDHYREEIRALLRLLPQSRPSNVDIDQDSSNSSNSSRDPRELEAKLKLMEEERNFFRLNYQELLADNLTTSERRRAPSGCVTTTDKGISAVDEELEELRKQKIEAEHIVQVLQERLDQAQENIMNLLKDKESLLAEMNSRQEVLEGGIPPSSSRRSFDDPHSQEGEHQTDSRPYPETPGMSTLIIQHQQDVKRAQEEVQKIRKELEESEVEIQRLHEMLNYKDKDLSSLDGKMKSQENIISSLQERLSSQEAELDSLRNTLERVQGERDIAISLSASAQQMEHLHDQQKQEALGIQSSVLRGDQQTSELQHEVRLREAELSSLREQLRIEKEKCSNLEEERENIRKEHRRTLDDLVQMTSQLQMLGQELESVRDEKATLKRQIQEYVTEVTRVQELLEIKERERLDLLDQYAHLSSEHIELERQHSSLEMHNDSVANMLSSKDRELEVMQETISSLENEIQQHLMSQEAMSSQVFHLNGSVSELDSQLEQITTEAKKLQEDLEVSKKRCKELEDTNGQLLRQVNVSQNDKDQLCIRHEAIQQEMCELREQLSILRGHISQLENLLVSCRESEYRHQTSSQVASSQAENLDKELKDTKEALDMQRRNTLDLKSKLADLELQLDKMKRDLTNEKFEKERAHQELRRYRQQHSCYVERHGSSPPTVPEVQPIRTSRSVSGRLAATFSGTDKLTKPKKITFSEPES